MANTTNIQVILDGPRNCVVKVEGTLDTSDLSSAVLVDPALLAGMDNTGAVKAAKLRINKISHTVEDGLEVRLSWDAATPARIESLTGREDLKFHHFGGLPNNAGAGVNGKILISTEGWSAGKILSFTVVLEMVKQQS